MRLDELASRLQCELHGDGAIEIRGVATLDDARAGDITFLSNPRYASKATTTKASAIIVSASFAHPLDLPSLRARDPYFLFARTLEIFFRAAESESGIHPTAVIHPSTDVGPGATIGPYAVIGPRVRIGTRAHIGAHVCIGPETEIGDDFVAHAHVSVRERVHIGHRVILQNGAVIGGDGFGYAVSEENRPYKIVQAGTVILEDDVEVGANSTIDRATVGVTRIRRGTKIDNLVMIAHGCDVGEGCFLAAQVGIAGSTTLGRHVQLGGQVGVTGHVQVGDFARAAARSGIPNDVPAGQTVGGYPAVDISTWRRVSAAILRLPDVLRRVRRIERTLQLAPPGEQK